MASVIIATVAENAMFGKLLLWSLLTVLLLVLAGWWLADWLTPRAVGEPAHALPVSVDATALDRTIVPMLDEHPGQSGAMLLADGLDAFAFRAASAVHAGRSLDVQYYIWLIADSCG